MCGLPAPCPVRLRGIGERAVLIFRTWQVMVDGPSPAVGAEIATERRVMSRKRTRVATAITPTIWGEDNRTPSLHSEPPDLTAPREEPFHREAVPGEAGEHRRAYRTLSAIVRQGSPRLGRAGHSAAW